MTIRFDGFPRKYQVSVEGKTSYDAGYSWGNMSRENVRIIMGKLSLDVHQAEYVSRSLAYMKTFASSTVFDYHGVNYASRYMSAFRGFCQGAGVDELTCAAIQMEYGFGCQTVFAQGKTGSVNFFHMEENVDDGDVTRMYWNAQSGYKPSSMENSRHTPSYNYRLVDWKTPGEELLFLSYPGLASGGASMGVNRITGSVMVVDTINPLSVPGLFWHNALASMIFSAGTIDAMRFFSSRIIDSVVGSHGFCGGYAIHMLEPSGDMLSFEFGGNIAKVIHPRKDGKNRFIAQSNYPRNKLLRDTDKYSKKQSEIKESTVKSMHLAMSARVRTRRLIRCAKTLYPDSGSTVEQLRFINRTLHTFRGDWEQSADSYVSNGVFSIYVAAYLTGYCDRKQCTVVFHAPVLGVKPVCRHQWWPLGKKLPWGNDLFAKAQKRLDMLYT